MENNQNKDRNQNYESQSKPNTNDPNRNNTIDGKNPTNANEAIVNKQDGTPDKGINPVLESTPKQNDRAYDTPANTTQADNSGERGKDRESASERNYKSQIGDLESTTRPPVDEKERVEENGADENTDWTVTNNTESPDNRRDKKEDNTPE